MWRRFQHGPTSAAELSIRIELQKRHLLHKLKPEGTVILFTKKGIKIIPKERFTKKMRKGRKYTIPDFLYCGRHGIYPWYIDGPPHKRDGVKERDERINETLRKNGVEPIRFPYKSPLRKFRLKEICDTIQAQLTRHNRAEIMREAQKKAPEWV